MNFLKKLFSLFSRLAHDLLDRGDPVSKAREKLRLMDERLVVANNNYFDASAAIGSIQAENDALEDEIKLLNKNAAIAAKKNTQAGDALAAEYLMEADKKTKRLLKIRDQLQQNRDVLKNLTDNINKIRDERESAANDIELMGASASLNKARAVVATQTSGDAIGEESIRSLQKQIATETMRVDALESVTIDKTKALNDRLADLEPVTPIADRIAELRK